MSLTTNKYEYISEDTINDDLKCIICTQPFESPVSLDCKHTFCLSCIETWINQNSSCPICRHQFGTGYMLNKVVPGTLSNQLDCLLVRCIKCNKTDIKRANFKAHSKRCSKNRITRTSNLLRKRWSSIKTIIQRRPHCQTTVRNAEEIVNTNHELPDVLYRSYQRREQQQQQISNFYARIPLESTHTTAAVTVSGRELLAPLITAFRKFINIVILLFFIVTVFLISVGIFWTVLFVIFLIWFDQKLQRRN